MIGELEGFEPLGPEGSLGARQERPLFAQWESVELVMFGPLMFRHSLSPRTLPNGKFRKEGVVGGQGVGAYGGMPSASTSPFPVNLQTLFSSVLARSIKFSIFPRITAINAPK